MRTTAKPVIEALRTHILEQSDADHYGGEPDKTPLQNLVDQLDCMRWGDRTTYRTALDWVEGGGALIYHHDVNDFLNDLDINPTGKEYDTDKSWKLYCHLVAREMTKLYEGSK